MIQQDDEIRIKIVGLRVDATDIVIIITYLFSFFFQRMHHLSSIYFNSLPLERSWTITWVWSANSLIVGSSSSIYFSISFTLTECILSHLCKPRHVVSELGKLKFNENLRLLRVE